MKPSRYYIPKLTHTDNQTRRWQKVIFVLDKKARNIRVGSIHTILLAKTPSKIKVSKVLGEGWYECRMRG